MKTKRLITAICGITLASVSIFNNVNINEVKAAPIEHEMPSDSYYCFRQVCDGYEANFDYYSDNIGITRIISLTDDVDAYNITIPSYVISRKSLQEEPVLYIGDYFASRSHSSLITSIDKITSITIPDTVISIGKYAFGNSGYRTRVGFTKLKSLIIPDSVTSIGEYAFNNCVNLTSMNIPDSVTSIGEGIFYNCENLESVTISNNLTSIPKETFYNCHYLNSITIPDSVVSIDDSAFNNCYNLKDVVLSENLEYINENVFNGCDRLQNLTIPKSVRSISISTLDGLFKNYDDYSITFLSDNIYFKGNSEKLTNEIFSNWSNRRVKIYAHENSTIYNAYKHYCYTNYSNDPVLYEEELSKFNIIENDTDTDTDDNTDINDDTQWYTVVKSPDVNNDGRIDASDASDILNYYAYISTGGELSFEDFTALK